MYFVVTMYKLYVTDRHIQFHTQFTVLVSIGITSDLYKFVHKNKIKFDTSKIMMSEMFSG